MLGVATGASGALVGGSQTLTLGGKATVAGGMVVSLGEGGPSLMVGSRTASVGLTATATAAAAVRSGEGVGGLIMYGFGGTTMGVAAGGNRNGSGSANGTVVFEGGASRRGGKLLEEWIVGWLIGFVGANWWLKNLL